MFKVDVKLLIFNQVCQTEIKQKIQSISFPERLLINEIQSVPKRIQRLFDNFDLNYFSLSVILKTKVLGDQN